MKKRGRRSAATRSPRKGAPTAEVRIESIAAGGEGVGRLPDGRAVFVHRTAPGDLARVSLTTERPRWARGRLLEVIEPSPVRRAAPCPHYADCGGCTLEHLEYPAQLAAKSRIAGDALRRIGGIDTGAPEVVPSPKEHRYRNRVSFALRRTRAAEVIAGFHALHDPDRIVPIDGTCLLPEQPISDVWDRLRISWGPGAELLPSGASLRLTLRSTAAGEVSLLIEGGRRDGRLEELASRVEGLKSIWHRTDDDESARHAAAAPGLPESWGDDRFEVAGAAFLQVNRSAAQLLEAHVLSLCSDVRAAKVVDAYCGIGAHGRRLAAQGVQVVGLELDEDAVRIARTLAASKASTSAGTEAMFECGRVEDVIEAHLPADLVILNPPRAGVDPRVVEKLLERPARRIVYISCDPATLSRDLKGLSSSYSVTSVRCFDLFPQTAHVETVVALDANVQGTVMAG